MRFLNFLGSAFLGCTLAICYHEIARCSPLGTGALALALGLGLFLYRLNDSP